MSRTRRDCVGARRADTRANHRTDADTGTGADAGQRRGRRTANPDLHGVWQRPYTPDMSRNGRGQLGYAEPPFSPADAPAKREEMHKAGNYAELPFTPAGLERLEDLRPDQRRLHRQLPAVRHEPLDELARSAADHAERQIHRPAVRAELLVPHRQASTANIRRTSSRRGSATRSAGGTATRSSSTPSASTATRGSTRSAIRTATRCT